MGLGKTVQAIAAAEILRPEDARQAGASAGDLRAALSGRALAVDPNFPQENGMKLIPNVLDRLVAKAEALKGE
jgi:hypothetical protein